MPVPAIGARCINQYLSPCSPKTLVLLVRGPISRCLARAKLPLTCSLRDSLVLPQPFSFSLFSILTLPRICVPPRADRLSRPTPPLPFSPSLLFSIVCWKLSKTPTAALLCSWEPVSGEFNPLVPHTPPPLQCFPACSYFRSIQLRSMGIPAGSPLPLLFVGSAESVFSCIGSIAIPD